MQDGIKVGGAGIDALVADMQQGLDGINTRLEDMKSDLDKYVSQWDGSAREAYSQAQRDWEKQIQECRQLLNDVRTAVISSKEDYMAGEQRNTQRWG
ncbi:WXG100 family type VII secretion target [Phycicoccus sp. CSK15P-2]|uniref:WXG100 family type VII secretion target n=1 Tax=Phycicoccus sp. CSK15P-2 TaxID=2807627 RepID=UPI0019507731|nr:WXG100 family type VII secretion target [Phycicoccus sp. CSK15P-2]MBM6404231.1 WXG100 family type VII secretion target [Phycicoccus sp. CSK15P-2]